MLRLYASLLASVCLMTAIGCDKDANQPDTKKAEPSKGNLEQRQPVASPNATDGLQEIEVSCVYIDRCIQRLAAEPESELTGERAASIIMSAERTLPAFWGVDLSRLSEAQRKKIDSYPDQIHEWIDRINEVKSKQRLKQIKHKYDEYKEWIVANKDDETITWQAFILRDEEIIKDIQRGMSLMTEGKSFDAAYDMLIDAQKALNKHQRGQYTAYQKKALRRLHRFVGFVLTNTIARDSTLRTKFDEAEIASIDAGLLNAGTRRLYDTAIGMMDDKLKERERAKFLLDLTEAEKWSLSDF